MTLELNNQETTNFIFDIVLIPDIKYKLTSVNIPALSIGTIDVYPHNQEDSIPFAGTSIDYDDLNITFIVDTKLQNYNYIFEWMKILIRENRIIEINTTTTDPILQELMKKNYSDAILFIYNGENLMKKIRYVNIFPFSLGEIQFSTNQSYNLSVCNVSFKYEHFVFMD